MAKSMIDISADRLYVYSSLLDACRPYRTDGLTPTRLSSLWKSIDNGEVGALIELQEEMEAKDARIQSCASTRRNKLIGNDWKIVARENDSDDPLAIEAAAYCAEVIASIPSFESVLQHMASSITTNIAAVELVWENMELADVVPIPGHRLRTLSWLDNSVRVATDADLAGVSPDPRKFIVSTPNIVGGFPIRVSIARAASYLYMFKRFALQNWNIFNEVYATGARYAKMPPGMDDTSRDELMRFLRDFGTDGYGVFTGDAEIAMLESSRTGKTYEEFVRWADDEISILYLGQTKTTDAEGGSFALAKVHDEVRGDLAGFDARREASWIESRLFRLMVDVRFPGRDAPVPAFRRIMPTARDINAERMGMDQLREAMRLKLPVELSVVYERLGIPVPGDGELFDYGEKPEPAADPNATGAADEDSSAEEDGDEGGTNVDRVVAGLNDRWSTAREISQRIGMDVRQVRNVVQKGKFRKRIQRRRAGWESEYRARL